MILPDTLAPLPVTPNGDERTGNQPFQFDDFVCAGDVRKVILGTVGELPVEGLPADDFDSFAGRADVPLPPRSSFSGNSNGRVVELQLPDLVVEQQVLHPAFTVLPPEARRAAPPLAKKAVDCEASYGRRSRMGERWWVIGMGLAACAVLFSGTLVDFISREAVRRSRVENAPAPQIIHVPAAAPAKAVPAAEETPASLAATQPPEED